MVNYVFGLGGRNFGLSDALALYDECMKIDGEFLDEHDKLRYWGIRE